MNRHLRVLMIGRSFWPQGAIDSAGYLIQLATGLHRRGIQVEVLTPRSVTAWPEAMTFREIRVHRPTVAPRGDWSMSRYVRHLTTWLRQHAGSYDLMLADAIRDEAAAAIEASRSVGCPTLLIASRWGEHSDTQWWKTTRAARRCASIGKMADAVIVKNAAAERALLGEGYAAARIHRIEPGFAAGPQRSAAARSAARKTLAAVNGDLIAGDDAPVLICTTRMPHEAGLESLVKAAPHLIARYPKLRLWFIGDGPHRDWIYDYLRAEGCRSSIAMPGTFCDVDDLFAAADLYVQTDDDGLDYFFPTAVAAELPMVALDTAAVRGVIQDHAGLRQSPDRDAAASDPGNLIHWVPTATAKQMRIGVARCLDDLPAARQQASQLRRLLLRNRPHTETIESYLRLIQQLVARRTTSPSSASLEPMS